MTINETVSKVDIMAQVTPQDYAMKLQGIIPGADPSEKWKGVDFTGVGAVNTEETSAAPQEQGISGERPLSNEDLANLRDAYDAIQRAAVSGIQVGQDVVGQIASALQTGKAPATLDLNTAATRGNEAEALTTQKVLSEGLGTAALAMAGGTAAAIVIPGASNYAHLASAVKNASAGFVAFFDKNADGTSRAYLEGEQNKENPYATVETKNTGQYLAEAPTLQSSRNVGVLAQVTVSLGQSIGRTS